MSNASNNEIISKASAHTINKFVLIEHYVNVWARILLNVDCCKGISFIDCMCNSGEYYDENGQKIFGTAVRVYKVLRDLAGQYRNKQIHLYFNDINEKKVSHLEQLINNSEQNNFHLHFSTVDGNTFLRTEGPNIYSNPGIHYLLVYDPYDANIDWDAIRPYINNWGELIINHSLMDSTRAVKVAKSDKAVKKYETTYQMDIKNLSTFGSSRSAYEKRIEEIIVELRENNMKDYYIAAAPFFNKKNTIAYNLIHCTSNIVGFRHYKNIAWKTFGGKSSTKDTRGAENQLVFDLKRGCTPVFNTDDDCYYTKDIAAYLQSVFEGQQNVKLATVWDQLDSHHIFPNLSYRNEIKNELKQQYNAKIQKSSICFSSRSQLNE